jgi:eukaryotic-like serine/threonine-protein kinase
MPKTEARIGRYEVAGRLATGGMAELFLARQTGPSGFERPVVIKRVLPHLARERDFRDMFLDEARLVVQIRHPNVVQVQELGDDGGDLFLVMEYLEGESLSSLAKRLTAAGERLPDRVALHVVAEACAGLHAAHELRSGDRHLGLVHRDVSPHNLFVLYSGQIKVIDFGIAKAADRSSKTQTGTVKGKFAYMAPEQVRAEEVDRRADVFSLGVVLHELLTGKPLFARPHDFLMMQAVCLEPIPPPSATREVPAEVERVVMKALARDPSERYESALALRRDLSALLAGMQTGALVEEELARIMQTTFVDRIGAKADMLRRVSTGEALPRVVGDDGDSGVVQPITGTVSPAQVSLAPERPVARQRWPLAAGAAALVGVGLGIGLFASRRSPSSEAAPREPTSADADRTPTATASARVDPVPTSTSAPLAASGSAAVGAPSGSAAVGAPPPTFTRPSIKPRTPATSAPTAGFGRFD